MVPDMGPQKANYFVNTAERRISALHCCGLRALCPERGVDVGARGTTDVFEAPSLPRKVTRSLDSRTLEGRLFDHAQTDSFGAQKAVPECCLEFCSLGMGVSTGSSNTSHRGSPRARSAYGDARPASRTASREGCGNAAKGSEGVWEWGEEVGVKNHARFFSRHALLHALRATGAGGG